MTTIDTLDFRITPDHRARLRKSGDRHKHDYGHAVIVSGPPGQGGAARLAARGALRIGAGLVSVATTPEGRDEHAAHLDAIMVKTCDAAQDFADCLATIDPTAICIGPNLGLGSDSRDWLIAALASTVPLCLDADAITLIARDDDIIDGIDLSRCVMTPHTGELRRLIPDAFERTECRTTLAREAAEKFGCTILFKGTDTIVARADGPITIVKSGEFAHAPWLATAGSGDVLSGLITGLIARGFDAPAAAALAAQLHLQCAQIIGPGLIAEDLPDALPRVLAQCLASDPTD